MANCALHMYLFYYFRGTGAAPELSRHGRPWSSIGRQLLPITRPWKFQRFRALVVTSNIQNWEWSARDIIKTLGVPLVLSNASAAAHKLDLASSFILTLSLVFTRRPGSQGWQWSRGPGVKMPLISMTLAGQIRVFDLTLHRQDLPFFLPPIRRVYP